MSDNQHEVRVGHVMDVACVRKAPSDELIERASTHTTARAPTGHCIESGFALVDDDRGLHLLEPAATTGVVRELRRAGVEKGLRFEAVRELDGQEMRTVDLRSVAAEGRG